MLVQDSHEIRWRDDEHAFKGTKTKQLAVTGHEIIGSRRSGGREHEAVLRVGRDSRKHGLRDKNVK